MESPRIDVVYDGPLWSVVVAEEQGIRSHHATQPSAVYTAKRLATQMGAVLVVHDHDGNVETTRSYGASAH